MKVINYIKSLFSSIFGKFGNIVKLYIKYQFDKGVTFKEFEIDGEKFKICIEKVEK